MDKVVCHFHSPHYAACEGDCTICNQSNLDCDGHFKEWKKENKYNFNFHEFKPYFDVTMNKVVESKREIREFCKKNDMVYAGDAEITQQCEQNKRENQARLDREISEGIEKIVWERA